MPGNEEYVCEEASVRENATRKSETFMKGEVVALRRSIEELNMRAETDPLIAEVARLAAGEREEAATRGATSTVPTSGQGAKTGTSQLFWSRPT